MSRLVPWDCYSSYSSILIDDPSQSANCMQLNKGNICLQIGILCFISGFLLTVNNYANYNKCTTTSGCVEGSSALHYHGPPQLVVHCTVTRVICHSTLLANYTRFFSTFLSTKVRFSLCRTFFCGVINYF